MKVGDFQLYTGENTSNYTKNKYYIVIYVDYKLPECGKFIDDDGQCIYFRENEHYNVWKSVTSSEIRKIKLERIYGE